MLGRSAPTGDVGWASLAWHAVAFTAGVVALGVPFGIAAGPVGFHSWPQIGTTDDTIGAVGPVLVGASWCWPWWPRSSVGAVHRRPCRSPPTRRR